MIQRCCKRKKRTCRLLAPAIALLLGAAVFCGPAGAQVVPVDPPAPAPALSLKDVVAPEPTNLYAFLKGDPRPDATPDDQAAAALAKELAIVLGKALFWDMQVGSDDVQACASCHFNAGADFRTKNQLTPSDDIFGNATTVATAIPLANLPPGPNDPPFNYGFGPNFSVEAQHFPFHRRSAPTAPDNETAAVILMDTNDVMSSQGVRENDSATDPADPTFTWKGANVRKVEPRNAPSMINAVFHMDMFWDGRASFVFNGVNPFGFRDRDATVLRNLGTANVPDIQAVPVRIPLAGHASQAVGPPESTLEMTGFMRSFPELAEKLLAPELNPLALQMVHPDDSVLGPYAMAYYEVNRRGRQTGKLINVPGTKNPVTGDALTYQELVEQVFKEEWWNGGVLDEGADNQRTQMEENFYPVLRPGHAAVPGQSGGG
jgi:cytochrome c peroxidase